MEYANAYINGIFTGASLIMAIGAQNAFVLTQAIRRNHALPVSALCAVIDTLLIAAGVCGIGTLVAQNAILNTIACLGGAVFLIWFGLNSLKQAFKKRGMQVNEGENTLTGLWPTIAATLAVSLLNPHVYLDTVVMLGAVSGNFPGDARFAFGIGAVTASWVWFLSLCIAGRVLSPLFKKPRAWQILYILVTIMVWWVAANLILYFFN